MKWDFVERLNITLSNAVAVRQQIGCAGCYGHEGLLQQNLVGPKHPAYLICRLLHSIT